MDDRGPEDGTADGERYDRPPAAALEKSRRLIRVHEEPLETTSVSIPEVARTAWAAIETRDAELTVLKDFELTADPTQLQLLFEELFENALAHAGPEALVWVGPQEQIHSATRAGPGSDYIGFYVEDDGPGIPAEQREAVFDIDGTTDDPTVGYGLALVKAIADAHDWQCHVTTGSFDGARIEITGI